MKLGDLANGDGASLVTEGEAAQTRGICKGFHAQWSSSLDHDNTLLTLLQELWWLLGLATGLLVNQVEHGREVDLLDGVMNMENSGVSSADNVLMVENSQLSLKLGDNMDGVLGTAQNESDHDILKEQVWRQPRV